ncbi:Chaperone protein ClpB (ATP-dependent unfoldase) [Olavius algarvensis Delta 1 endosymbiont]|nr:Chaperone protein ClpB (ATP-dependent unfoldase) [Olavius algarvensis Delta 1 endosymbiont]
MDLKDEYVSVEHILLVFIGEGSGTPAKGISSQMDLALWR